MSAVIYLHWTATGHDWIRPGASGNRAWCREVEFAEEFGISVSYEPLVMGDRRGG